MSKIEAYINALQKTLGNKTGSTNPTARSMSSGASSRTPARTIQARNNQQIRPPARPVARPSAQLVDQPHSSSEAMPKSVNQNSSRGLAEHRPIKLRSPGKAKKASNPSSPEKTQEVSDRDLLGFISELKDNFKKANSDSKSDEESDRDQGAASSRANDKMPVGLFGLSQLTQNNGSNQSHTSTSTTSITSDRKDTALNGANNSDTEHKSADKKSDHGQVDVSSSESSSDDNDNKESDRSQNTRPKRLFSNQTRTREGDLFKLFPFSSESSSDDDDNKESDYTQNPYLKRLRAYRSHTRNKGNLFKSFPFSSESSSDDDDNKESDRSQNTRPKRLFSNQTRTREGDLFKLFPFSSESSSDDNDNKEGNRTQGAPSSGANNRDNGYKSADEESDLDPLDSILGLEPKKNDNFKRVNSDSESDEESNHDLSDNSTDVSSSESNDSDTEYESSDIESDRDQNARLKKLRANRSRIRIALLKRLRANRNRIRIAGLKRLLRPKRLLNQTRTQISVQKSFLPAPKANANNNAEGNRTRDTASSGANNKMLGLFGVSQPMPNAESPKSSPRDGSPLSPTNLHDEFNKVASTSNPFADEQQSSTLSEGQNQTTPSITVKQEEGNKTPPSQQTDGDTSSSRQDRLHVSLNPTAAASGIFSSIDEVMGLFPDVQKTVVNILDGVRSEASAFIKGLNPSDQATFYLVFRTKDKHVFYIKATIKPNKTLSKPKIRTFNKGDIQIGGKDKLIFMKNLGPSLTVGGLWRAATEGLNIAGTQFPGSPEMAKTNVAATDSKTPHKTPKRK